MRRRPRALALALVVAGLAARGSSAQFAPPTLASLFAAYEAGDFAVVARQLTSAIDYDRIHQREIEPAIEAWKRDRRPVQATFLLDLALVAHNRRWDTWLDVVCMAREFVTSRALVDGAEAADSFELAWHKTSIALLEGQRRPDFLFGQGVEPLARRMSAAASDGGSALVDPWLELAWGRLYEQRALVRTTMTPPQNCYSRSRRPAPPSGRTTIAVEGPRAIEHYEKATRFPSTRNEARVRQAWVLLQLERPDEAIAALDAIDQPFGDEVVRYWHDLFRGRALAALGRSDEAVAAYDRALAIAPAAQAPHVGALAVELGRGNSDAAWRRAALVRRPVDAAAVDPWWQYWSGDFRLFDQRIAALRRLAR